jgi:hypothetical protein
MVYQEDVIKIALHFGGLSAPDGDVLRRAMSGKGRSLSALQKVKDNSLNPVKGDIRTVIHGSIPADRIFCRIFIL